MNYSTETTSNENDVFRLDAPGNISGDPDFGNIKPNLATLPLDEESKQNRIDFEVGDHSFNSTIILEKRLTSKDVRKCIDKIPLHKFPIRCLRGHFCEANSIILTLPKPESETESISEALRVVYRDFLSMEPDLTFRPNENELRCRGYFTHDFDTCSFIAQIWLVHSSFALDDASGMYVFELRRTSVDGRESFHVLRRAVAVSLKCAGYAKKYANGYAIHDYTCEVGLTSDCSSIHLSTDGVNILTSRLAKRTCPQYCQTLRLLAQCSACSRDNCKVLKQSDGLSKVVFSELADRSNASSCLNALKLIEYGAVVLERAIPVIANIMLVYCAKKPRGYKGLRSLAIQNAALGAMKQLLKSEKRTSLDDVTATVEKILLDRLDSDLLCKVKTLVHQSKMKILSVSTTL